MVSHTLLMMSICGVSYNNVRSIGMMSHDLWWCNWSLNDNWSLNHSWSWSDLMCTHSSSMLFLTMVWFEWTNRSNLNFGFWDNNDLISCSFFGNIQWGVSVPPPVFWDFIIFKFTDVIRRVSPVCCFFIIESRSLAAFVMNKFASVIKILSWFRSWLRNRLWSGNDIYSFLSWGEGYLYTFNWLEVGFWLQLDGNSWLGNH